MCIAVWAENHPISAAATQERKKLSINQNIYTVMEQEKTTMNLKSEVIHKFIFKSPREGGTPGNS